MMRTIEEYASLGERHDVMDALRLLTLAYISQCGVSLGFRTVIYVAAEAWQEKLAWMDLPLSEKARKEPLALMMPDITSEYDPEMTDRYDICGMDNDELVAGCRQIVAEGWFGEPTMEVLCWGIKEVTTKEKMKPQPIEAVAADGTQLKAILYEQSHACTRMEMMAPFDDVSIVKIELILDVRALLVTAYEEYIRLHSMEKEVKELYPKYLEELDRIMFFSLSKKRTRWKKQQAFDRIYAPIVKETTVLTPDLLFQKWYGLDFGWE